MEENNGAATVQMGLSGTRKGNTLQENDSLIEDESGHIKVFRIPNRQQFPKRWIIISILISILLIVGGVAFWTLKSNQTQSGQWKDSQLVQETKAEENIIVVKDRLLKYLGEIHSPKVLSGICVEANNSKPVPTMGGEQPAIVSAQIRHYPFDSSQWKSLIADVIYNWNNHYLVRIGSYEGRNFASMDVFGATRHNTRVENDRRWSDLINNGGQLNKIWKGHLDQIAPYLQQLQTAGVVTIFDILPWQSMSGYEIWRGRPGVDGTMKFYKMTHDYLTKVHNLTGLIWTWSLAQWNMHMPSELYWPGSEYVDVVSVYMSDKKQLAMTDYQNLVNVVGDKPMSMENLWHVPPIQLFAVQKRWTWFTIDDFYSSPKFNTTVNIKAIFNSNSVIKRGSIDFFD